MGSFRNSYISRRRAWNRKKYYFYVYYVDLMLLLGAIFLLPTSSNRQVPPFAPIAVFLFGPLIQERLDIGTAMPISGHDFLVSAIC